MKFLLLGCLCFLIRLLTLHFLPMPKKYIPITISAVVALMTYFANYAAEDRLKYADIRLSSGITLLVLTGLANTVAWGAVTYQAVSLLQTKPPRKK